MLHSAALQRDVLQARGGLLGSYDPFVRSMAKLRTATADLPTAREVASGEARADIDRKIAEVAAAVRDQEALVEAFKSDNALLRNSLAYFIHMSGRLATAAGRLPAAEVGALTMAMLRFVDEPRPDAGAEVTAALDRLARLPGRCGAGGGRELARLPRPAHRRDAARGRRVSSPECRPARQRTRARRCRTPISTPTGARRPAPASSGCCSTSPRSPWSPTSPTCSFASASNARILRRRLEFEALIASISTEFINLSRGGIRDNISKALARLVEHAGLDDAQIVVHRDGEVRPRRQLRLSQPCRDRAGSRARGRCSSSLSAGRSRAMSVRAASMSPTSKRCPESPEKASLQARDIRSWLCIPMWLAGERLGFLALGAVTREKRLRRTTSPPAHRRRDLRERHRAGAHEAEREALQARLNQSQRLEAIGTLAGGIAHEFNNILAVIIGYGEMALPSLRRDFPGAAPRPADPQGGRAGPGGHRPGARLRPPSRAAAPADAGRADRSRRRSSCCAPRFRQR